MSETEKRRNGETEKGRSDSPLPRFFASPAPVPKDSRSLTLTPQRWICLSVTVPHEAAEAVANFLAELGSMGVIEGERDFQQPVPSTTDVKGFFAEDISTVALTEALQRYLRELTTLFPTLNARAPKISLVTDEAWHERWREHFPPLTVGSRFLLLPPWEPPPQQTNRIVIIIDPSMAFGTGHHATTQGCLEAIELLHAQYGAPDRALDLGTGSGILAIALAKLGARRLWATDIDPIALAEAEKNSEANGVTDCIQFSDLPLEHLPLPFALITANLFSTTLVALAPMLRSAVRTQGHAILSGIQLDQEREVLTVYSAPAWQLVTRLPKEEWVTLVVQRTEGA